MSQLAIQKYLNELSDLKKVSGTTREMVVREAFKDLFKGEGRSRDLVFIPEYEIVTPAGNTIYVDGALVFDMRLPFGYWEAKDQEDYLDKEIAKKFAKGYSQDNILFEDSLAIVRRSTGFSTSTRKRRRKTRLSAKSSTPIASPTTRRRSSISSRA